MRGRRQVAPLNHVKDTTADENKYKTMKNDLLLDDEKALTRVVFPQTYTKDSKQVDKYTSSKALEKIKSRYKCHSRLSSSEELRKFILELKIKMCDRQSGRLIQVGSSVEGCDVTDYQCVEFIYELDAYSPTQVKITRDDNVSCQITYNNTRLSASQVWRDFCDHLEEICRGLQDCVKFAGFGSPRFTGLRHGSDHVVVSILVDTGAGQEVVPVKISVGLRVPQHLHHKLVTNKLFADTLMSAIHRDIQGYDVEVCLHLVATPGETGWVFSTTAYQANILKALPYNCPVKLALRMSRVLVRDCMDVEWTQDEGRSDMTKLLDDQSIVREMRLVLEAAVEQPDIVNDVAAIMRNHHTRVGHRQAAAHKEPPVALVTVTNTALTHLTLAQGMEVAGAFSSDASDGDVTECVLQKVWQYLAANNFYVDHLFLDCKIRLVTVCEVLVDHWLYTVLVTRQQTINIHRALHNDNNTPAVAQQKLTQIPAPDDPNVLKPQQYAQSKVEKFSLSYPAMVKQLASLRKTNPNSTEFTEEDQEIRNRPVTQLPDLHVPGRNLDIVPMTTVDTYPVPCHSVIGTLQTDVPYVSTQFDDVTSVAEMVENLRERREMKYESPEGVSPDRDVEAGDHPADGQPTSIRSRLCTIL